MGAGSNQTPGSWKIRIEKDNVDIKNGSGLYNYSGEAIRIDYYEGGNTIENDDTVRESWYFVKDVGLVKIVSKLFNNYGDINTKNGKTLVADCKDDSDCWDDNIQSPHFVVTLKQVFQNPTLSASVGTNKTKYSTRVDASQTKGYYLKVKPAYTGYLEATIDNGSPARWLWAEDGEVKVPNPGVAGSYNLKVRIWVPNELDPGETIGKDPVQLPWSNQVTVNVIPSSDVHCKLGTWYTDYNYSGTNWCPTNNQLCTTDWIQSPKETVSCGTKRLINKGTYCTRSNNTASFTGTSDCVD